MGDSHNLIELISESDISAKVKKMGLEISSFYEGESVVFVVILSISNQKEYTKLKVLIWDTPRLSLGTYIAISASTGFILSYLLTTNLANINKSSSRKSLQFKVETEHEENNERKEVNTGQLYENTLIERDIKDPAPTINASFRIISSNGRSDKQFINNNKFQYDDSIEYEEQYDEQPENTETIIQEKPISYDWNDDSYTRW